MGTPQERIEALRGLIERLSAPDLTLTEAQVLRGSLSVLIERDEQPTGRDRLASPSALLLSPGRVDGACHDVWSPEPPMRATG